MRLDYGRKQEQLFALNPSATFALSKFDWSNYAVGQESLLEISSRLGFYASNAVVSFSADEISRLEARTGASFARIYYDPGMQTPVVGGDISRPAHWFWYADYDRRESLLAWNACVTELAGTEEAARNEYDLAYLAGQAAHRNGVDHFLDSEAYARSLAIACLPEEDIAGFGCSMLAGRMPQAVDEIAVSECFYREFEARGYCLYDDIAAGEMIVPVYNDRYAEGYDPAKPDGYVLNIDEIPSREEALTSASVEKERREIGILKSLGAKDRDIYRIFLAESLIVGLCVFCVALAATCGIVYGVFGGFLVQGASVMLMQVGVWQVLLLLAISLAVPTGMGVLSVRQMLRASPVEIMRAKDRRKKPARQRGI